MFFKPSSASVNSYVLQPRSLLAGVGLTLFGLLGSVQVAADELDRSHSYRVDVPVVSAIPVVETRTVERPERVCQPVNAQAARIHRDESGGQYHRRGYRDDFNGREYYYGYRNDQRYDDRRYDDRYGDRRQGSVGRQILGGLIGGVIGNQFGGGRGKKAFTIAGALAGSAIARDSGASRSRSRGYSSRRVVEPDYVCRTTTRTRTIEDVIGYDVTYRYNGSLQTRRMDTAPGDTIELRVRARPLNNTVLTPATRPAQPISAANRARRTL